MIIIDNPKNKVCLNKSTQHLPTKAKLETSKLSFLAPSMPDYSLNSKHIMASHTPVTQSVAPSSSLPLTTSRPQQGNYSL